MGSWVWVLIWLILSIGALGYFAYLGFELLSKAKRLVLAGTKLVDQASRLVETAAALPSKQTFESNLLDDPGPIQAEYLRNLKKREAKRTERQRRLINKLIEYQADESEFKP